MQFWLYDRTKIDAVLIMRKMKEEFHVKGKKLYMCFVDLEIAFGRVSRNVLEWAMRKNRIPEVLARSVMSLYEGAKKIVRVDSDLSEEFQVKVEMHNGSVLSPFLFAVVVDVVTEIAIEGALSELLYADDLILMNETNDGLRNKLFKLKKAFESKGLNVNLGKTKVMVSGRVTKDGASESKVGPSEICSLRAKVNSVLCVQYGKWIHGRSAGLKTVPPVKKKIHMQKI